MNNVALMGRLTRTPELRRTEAGTAVANFALAVDRYSKGEKKTDFFECVAWSKTAEHITQYFNKGQMMAILGHLQTRTWEDRNGDKHKAVEVVVDNTYFCGSRSEAKTEPKPERLYDDFVDLELDENGQPIDNDLPF